MQVILYKQENKICVLSPVQAIADIVDFVAIAQKDVPVGCPYWIIDASTLPNAQQETWEIDETQYSPDGYGGESNEFSVDIQQQIKEVLGY